MISHEERMIRYLRAERERIVKDIEVKTNEIRRLSAELAAVGRTLTKIEAEGN